MARRTALILSTLASLLIVVLHLDFWRPRRAVLLGGWLPEELAYRVVELLLAWGVMLFICAYLWREGQD